MSLVLALLFTSTPFDGIISLAEQTIEESNLITVVEELDEYRTEFSKTYLKFTDLPQIPYDDYRIDGAYLMLTPKATTGNWEEMELGVYELTEDWKNHQIGKVAERITFNNAPEDVGYSTATASVSRGGADNGIGVGFEIAHIVEKWYDSPETNFGIKLAAHLEDSQYNDNLVFHSSRSQTGTAPYLSLTYKGVISVTDIEILNKIERIQDIQDNYWVPEAVVYPEDASDKRITWETSDSDIMCYSYGLFYVGEPGTVTITARSVDNPEKFDSIEVEVYNVPVEDVYISNKPENNELYVGESWQFFDAPYLEIVITDTNLLTINGGTITAKQAGLTCLEIRNIYNDALITEVHLSIEPKNLRISGIPSTVRVGEWIDFISLTSDCGATFDPSVTGWTSSNPEVFQITRGSGHEIYGRALSEGVAIIHVHVPYFGADVCFTVTVEYIEPDTVSIVTSNGKKDITIYISDIFSIDTTVEPDDAYCNLIYMMDEWHSTNDNISLLRKGYRTAVFQGEKAGTSKAYATVDGVKSNELNVTIKAPTATITNKPTNNTLYRSATHILSYESDPKTGVTVEWNSSNDSIAKINKTTGKITANADGSVIISIKVKYGNYEAITDSFTLTVDYPLATSIRITNLPANNLLCVGEWHNLDFEISPSDALQEAIWQSDAPDIIEVHPLTGRITAKKVGFATITVISECNGKKLKK